MAQSLQWFLTVALSLVIVAAAAGIVSFVGAAFDDGTFRRTASARIVAMLEVRMPSEARTLTEAQLTLVSSTLNELASEANSADEPQDLAEVVAVLVSGPEDHVATARRLRDRRAFLNREAVRDLDHLCSGLETERLFRAMTKSVHQMHRSQFHLRLLAIRECAPKVTRRFLPIWGVHGGVWALVACTVLVLTTVAGIEWSLGGEFASTIATAGAIAGLATSLVAFCWEALKAAPSIRTSSPRDRRIRKWFAFVVFPLVTLLTAANMAFEFSERLQYSVEPLFSSTGGWGLRVGMALMAAFLGSILLSNARDVVRTFAPSSPRPWSAKLRLLAALLAFGPVCLFLVAVIGASAVWPTLLEPGGGATLGRSHGIQVALVGAGTLMFFAAPATLAASAIVQGLERRSRMRQYKAARLAFSPIRTPWVLGGGWVIFWSLHTWLSPLLIPPLATDLEHFDAQAHPFAAWYLLLSFALFALGSPFVAWRCWRAAVARRRQDQDLIAKFGALRPTAPDGHRQAPRYRQTGR